MFRLCVVACPLVVVGAARRVRVNDGSFLGFGSTEGSRAEQEKGEAELSGAVRGDLLLISHPLSC
jgi:hypothetical protein